MLSRKMHSPEAPGAGGARTPADQSRHYILFWGPHLTQQSPSVPRGRACAKGAPGTIQWPGDPQPALPATTGGDGRVTGGGRERPWPWSGQRKGSLGCGGRGGRGGLCAARAGGLPPGFGAFSPDGRCAPASTHRASLRWSRSRGTTLGSVCVVIKAWPTLGAPGLRSQATPAPLGGLSARPPRLE